MESRGLFTTGKIPRKALEFFQTCLTLVLLQNMSHTHSKCTLSPKKWVQFQSPCRAFYECLKKNIIPPKKWGSLRRKYPKNTHKPKYLAKKQQNNETPFVKGSVGLALYAHVCSMTTTITQSLLERRVFQAPPATTAWQRDAKPSAPILLTPFWSAFSLRAHAENCSDNALPRERCWVQKHA